MNYQYKTCKYCGTEMKAYDKVCPRCFKKRRSLARYFFAVIGGVAAIILAAEIFSGNIKFDSLNAGSAGIKPASTVRPVFTEGIPVKTNPSGTIPATTGPTPTNPASDKPTPTKPAPAPTSAAPQPTEDVQKIYKAGDKYIFNNNGKDQFSLIINSIKLTDERNQFDNSNPEQVVIIDYTYENISGEKDVFISALSLKVFDGSGTAANLYPGGDISAYPKSLPAGIKGTKCENAQVCYGLKHKSTKITVLFQPELFNSKNNVSFELEIK